MNVDAGGYVLSPFIKVIGCLFVFKLALNVFEVSHYMWHSACREKSSGQWGYDGFISFNPYAEIVLLALMLFYAVDAREFFSRTVLFLLVAGLAAIVLSYALPIALGRVWIKIAKKRNDEHGSQ